MQHPRLSGGARLVVMSLAIGATVPAGLAQSVPPPDIPAITSERAALIDSLVPRILAEFKVATAGIGVIRNGKLAWAGYYGEQAPGIQASRGSMFNVASITKTVVAETILRLAAAGRLSLDEPMFPHWVDPDVAADPRHQMLTPRMALDHTTGFPNWRSGGTPMAMAAAPGASFNYSGEGFNYVARFAEEKLGKRFDLLVDEYVIAPIGMRNISLSTPNAWVSPYIVWPTHEAADGRRLNPGCNTTGQFCLCRADARPVCRRWTAADDMLVSVEDYSAFLISVMNGESLSSALRDERWRPRAFPRGDWQIVNCETMPSEKCPTGEGWSLGWEVVDYGANRVISHGGADWGEIATAYFYSRSRDGLIIFLNGRRPAANGAMVKLIRLIDAKSPIALRYDRWYGH